MNAARWARGALLCASALAGLNGVAPTALAAPAEAVVLSSCGSITYDATGNPSRPGTMDVNGKACTSGASSSASPFVPTGNATLAVSNSSTRVALGSADATTVIRNTGTTDFYIKLGSGSVTAATTDTLVPAGQAIVLATGVAVDVAAITASGSSTLYVTTGTGSALGWGGGGGGGAVTSIDGGIVTLGITTGVTPCATATTSGCTLTDLTRGLLLAAQSTNPVVTNWTQINGLTVPTNTGDPTSATQRVVQANPIGHYAAGLGTTLAITALAPAASATDIYTLAGSGTKAVRVKRVHIDCVATAAGSFVVALVKRSIADTSGTSTSPTMVPMDSNSAAATASVKAYTVNPTQGALVGVIRTGTLVVPATGSPVTSNPGVTWDFGIDQDQGPLLHGTNEQIAIYLNAVTMTGGACTPDVTWDEE